MTVDAAPGLQPRQGRRSPREDVEELDALAQGDDLAALEACCEAFEARYAQNHLALLYRCRAKERLRGAAAAAADAAENWSRYPPTAGLVGFVVTLMLRAGQHRGAWDVLRAVGDKPGLSGLVQILRWRIAVESGDPAALHDLLAAGPDEPGDPQLEAWKAAGLALLERPARAAARMLDAINRIERPATLLPVMRRFTGDARQAFVLALHARLDAEPDLSAPDNLLYFMAQSCLESGRNAEALQILQRLFTTEGPLADRARMLAAQCAASLGDPPAAREHLSALMMKYCPPALSRDMMATLGRVMFDWRGARTGMRFLSRVPQFRDRAGSDAFALDLVQGRFDRIIDEFFARSPDDRLAPGILFAFCSACTENSRWDDLRRGIDSLPLDGAIPAANLRRLRAVLSCLDAPELSRPVSLALLDRIAADSHEAFVLRLETAQGEALDDAARDALRHLQSGNPAIALRLALSCEGEGLLGRLSPDLAEGLRQQSIERMHLADVAQAPQIRSQRHLCTLIEAGFPESRPEAVSIIAPVHRARDLPNLAANIARQSWTNLEAIVVANGELYQSPLVAEALAGLPNVTIVHDRGRNVGGYLNLAARRASGDIVMRVDADDVYFAEYVRSSVRTLQAMDGEVGGKHSCFVWFERPRRVFLRNPALCYNDAQDSGHYGVGATHIFRREVFRDIQYPETVARGEDYLFFENCVLRGLRNVNLDPFNYMIVRRQDKAAHTWQVDDLSVLGSAASYVGGPEVVPLIAMPDRAGEPIPLPGI